MVHIVIVIAVATACLVMSYYYLRAGTAVWPPAGYARPDLLLPGLATLVLLAGALFVWWAERRIRSGAQGQLRLGLVGAAALGLAFLVLLISDTARSGISPSTQAYDSAVATLLGYQAVLVVGGLILLGVVQAQAWLGYFSARRFLAVQNTALYCIAVAINWLVIFAVVYLTPHVLGAPAYQGP
jgi:heme/copper-type cytochrome/quinol oxidase subunit 3